LKNVMCAQRLSLQMCYIWEILCKYEMLSRNVWFQVFLCCEASSNSVIASVSYDQEVGPDKWEAVPDIAFSAVLYDSVIQCPRFLSNSANGKWICEFFLWIGCAAELCQSSLAVIRISEVWSRFVLLKNSKRCESGSIILIRALSLQSVVKELNSMCALDCEICKKPIGLWIAAKYFDNQTGYMCEVCLNIF
jgi:hypothetical protein